MVDESKPNGLLSLLRVEALLALVIFVFIAIDQAFLLKDHWDNAQLKIISDGGHAVTEHGISKALVECCNRMLEILA